GHRAMTLATRQRCAGAMRARARGRVLGVLRALGRVDLDQQIVEELIAVVLGGLGERLEVLSKIVNGHLGHGVSPRLMELHARAYDRGVAILTGHPASPPPRSGDGRASEGERRRAAQRSRRKGGMSMSSSEISNDERSRSPTRGLRSRRLARS